MSAEVWVVEQWAASCLACRWEGPIRDNDEQGSRDDADEHDREKHPEIHGVPLHLIPMSEPHDIGGTDE